MLEHVTCPTDDCIEYDWFDWHQGCVEFKGTRGVFSGDQTFDNSNRFLRGLLTLLPDQIQSDINGTEGILLAAITTHNLSLLYLYVEGQVSSTHSSLKRMWHLRYPNLNLWNDKIDDYRLGLEQVDMWSYSFMRTDFDFALAELWFMRVY